MPIPTQHDRAMAEVDDLHGVVMIRLRTLQHAGARRGVAGVRLALEDYATAVLTLAEVGRR
jgi:hypothetical protein